MMTTYRAPVPVPVRQASIRRSDALVTHLADSVALDAVWQELRDVLNTSNATAPR
ncbi:MAG TPA: hypothetical protein VMU34_11245 [Mycobacterium sp.]|nr:hypothetical protein [Mycobacterium sp.]